MLGRAGWDIDQEIQHAGSNYPGLAIVSGGILPEFSQLPLDRVNVYRLQSHSSDLPMVYAITFVYYLKG